MCRHRLACLPLSHPFRSFVSLLAPSLVSCLCSPIRRLVSSCVPCRAYPVGMSVSSHPLIPPALVPLLASLCLFAPFLVSAGGGVLASRSHLVMRPVCRSACLLTALRSARSRVAVADVIASFMRSAATVPPPTLLALSPRLFVSGGGEMSSGWVGSNFFFVGFLRGRVLFLPCVCYNVCRGDGDLRMGGIRASVP